MPGIQVTDSVRHTVGNGIQVKGMGMDPGFHRGDDNAGMTGRAKVDFESTPTKSLGFEPRVV
jgi:hypothetical protein